MSGLTETKLTGVNAKATKSVLVSAVLEVHGQVRFGDGTDVNITVTETDMVLRPSDGAQIQKFIFAGSKRRGVDRRSIHALRDLHWHGEPCYIPNLCCECPICWFYGFTGTTQQKKDINAKSRILYASSVSVEDVSIGRNIHSRNQVDEKASTTAGEAGIHEEEIIVAGVHFPTYTTLAHVLDWEIGAFSHALLENINSNRYTAASRAQGGVKIAQHDETPLVIVDESCQGIFPLSVPKIPGWEQNWPEASKMFQNAMDKADLKSVLETQGFSVVEESGNNSAANKLVLEQNNGIITVKHGERVLMTRYTGNKALGYLRQKQLLAHEQFAALKVEEFHKDIKSYQTEINPKGSSAQTADAKDESDAAGN